MSGPLIITPSPWKTLGRAVRWGFCGVMVLGALWVVWDWFAGRALARELAAARARGEPVTVGDLEVKLGPGEENAAEVIKQAIAALHFSPEEAEIVDTPTRNYDDEPYYPLNEADLATARKLIVRQEPARNILRHLRDVKRAAWDVNVHEFLTIGMVHQLGAIRRLCNMLHVVATVQHQDGHDGDAVETMRDMLTLSDRADQAPFVVDHLVAVVLVSLTARTVLEIAPDLVMASDNSQGGATTEQLQTFIHELLDRRAMHRYLVRSFFADTAFEVNSREGLKGAGYFLLQPVMELSERRGVAVLEASARAADQITWPAVQAVMPPEPLGGLFGSRLPTNLESYGDFSLQEMYVNSRAILLHERTVLHCDAAATLLALRCYELDHEGALPATLVELTPRYLSAVPPDVFRADGGAITYVPSRRILYSFGENGVDDGGVYTTRERLRYWDKPDVIFFLDRYVKPPASPSGLPPPYIPRRP